MTRKKELLLRLIASVLVGVLAGCGAAIFLSLLEITTNIREKNMPLIGLLPLFGYLTAWMYQRYGDRAKGGYTLILDEIHDPKEHLPLRMAPLVLLATIITHLGGGSAGREGTAVQIGASLADQVSRAFKFMSEQRRCLLMAGAGAGFASAIGVPWAGIVFGIEAIHVGRFDKFAWFESLIASWVGFYTVHLLGVHHSIYPQVVAPMLQLSFLPGLIALAIVIGIAARLFVMSTHLVETGSQKVFRDQTLRMLFGGFLLVILYAWEGSYRFAGLGLEQIQQSFQYVVSWDMPLKKMIFTALTIGVGFKGGEFVPLVFIGSAIGSFFSQFLHLPLPLLAGLGFSACFSAAANTPLTGSLMMMELFGWSTAPYALLVCYGSYFLSPAHGIYKGQKIARSKLHFFNSLLSQLNTKRAKKMQ